MRSHCLRVVSAPVSAAVMITGLASKVSISYSSDRDVAVLAPGSLDLLATGDFEALDDHLARLGGVDDVVDHAPARRHVRRDRLADRILVRLARRRRVVRRLDLLVEDDVDRPLGAHHRYLR